MDIDALKIGKRLRTASLNSKFTGSYKKVLPLKISNAPFFCEQMDEF